ncbi:MAG: HipA family kinase, partial [Segetibacter sp.]
MFQIAPSMINKTPELRTVHVTRYVTPLREGGSLPAIAEADDGFLYVLKFRGAGQGVKALIAELIAGEIARTIGLRVPEIVFANLDEAFGRTEPDEEIQDLLKSSV